MLDTNNSSEEDDKYYGTHHNSYLHTHDRISRDSKEKVGQSLK